MLFVYEAEGRHAMWMKNTLIPLSVAFIDRSGRIINIEDMQPQTEDAHRRGACRVLSGDESGLVQEARDQSGRPRPGSGARAALTGMNRQKADRKDLCKRQDWMTGPSISPPASHPRFANYRRPSVLRFKARLALLGLPAL